MQKLAADWISHFLPTSSTHPLAWSWLSGFNLVAVNLQFSRHWDAYLRLLRTGDLLLIVKYIDSFLSGCSPTNEWVAGGCWLQRWRRRIGDLIRTWCIYSGELIRQEQSSCCLCLLQEGIPEPINLNAIVYLPNQINCSSVRFSFSLSEEE